MGASQRSKSHSAPEWAGSVALSASAAVAVHGPTELAGPTVFAVPASALVSMVIAV